MPKEYKIFSIWLALAERKQEQLLIQEHFEDRDPNDSHSLVQIL